MLFPLLNEIFTKLSYSANIALKFSVRSRVEEQHQIGKDGEDSATRAEYHKRNTFPQVLIKRILFGDTVLLVRETNVF
jgi:hypothetical protein